MFIHRALSALSKVSLAVNFSSTCWAYWLQFRNWAFSVVSMSAAIFSLTFEMTVDHPEGWVDGR
jgi:hypothetical protein